MITIILIFMCVGFHLASAQEPDDTPQGAIHLFPNGPSVSQTFSFYRDRDWFTFFAEKDVNYQIFTRPEKNRSLYNLPETVIHLFSDPTLGSIAYNEEIESDGSALITWLCPASGIYFVRVKANSSRTYGPREAYRIQITSIDRQAPHTIIPDVPDYSQSKFEGVGDCGLVAAACVLGYWDAHGYDLLVDSDPGRIEDVAKLIHDLQEAIRQYSANESSGGGMSDDHLSDAIQSVCNSKDYGNNYNFKADLDYTRNFSSVINEIKKNRPVLYGVIGHSIWGNHWMATVGYLETNNTSWTINHDNWDKTHKDIYVDWDEATECIITIQPVNIVNTDPFGSIPYYNYQYIPFPPFTQFPQMNIPAFGFGASPFFEMPAIPVTIWPFPLGTEYSNQFYWGGSGNIILPSNPGRSSSQSITTWDIYSGNPSPFGYDYTNIGYNPVYNNVFSIPTQEAYLGFGLSYYPSMNIPSQGSIDFFKNSLFSPSNMLFPDLGFLSYPVFSPFSTLFPGPFSFGFLF